MNRSSQNRSKIKSKTKKDAPQVIERTAKKHYSLLTFVLLICIAELAISSMNNINKNISFLSKIKWLENKRSEEQEKNEKLQNQIDNFDSPAALESITRNSLKMAGKNEVLVIIHKPKNSYDDIQEFDFPEEAAADE